jgi:hypothetical protein
VIEAEYQKVKEKVERELPFRRELARLAGVRLNDQTVSELYTLVAIMNPGREGGAQVIAHAALSGAQWKDGQQ